MVANNIEKFTEDLKQFSYLTILSICENSLQVNRVGSKQIFRRLPQAVPLFRCLQYSFPLLHIGSGIVDNLKYLTNLHLY